MIDELISDVIVPGSFLLAVVLLERLANVCNRPSKDALDYFSQSDDLDTFEFPLKPKYSAFALGKFQGKIFRKISVLPDEILKISNRKKGVNDILLMTIFSVAIPSVRSFYLKIEFPHLKNAKKKGSGVMDIDFASKIVWDIPEPELRAAFQTPEVIKWMRRLARSASGEILCRDGEFSIQLLRGLKSEGKLDSFLLISKRLFRIYAQIAQMNLSEWRLPENNHDWWQEEPPMT